MTLGKRLKNLRKAQGFSQAVVADALGYKSFTTIQKWESDDAAPPVQILEQLAAMYRCRISDFFDSTPSKRMIPILGTVVGGPPLTALQEFLGEHEVFMEADGAEYFYLRVQGDSMIDARIHPGDEVFVRRQAMVDNGDIAIVLIEDEATVKRVFIQDNKLILKPENRKYDAMEFELSQLNSENIMILGKVLHNRIVIK
ncbi:MAG: helix-turn-helix domain-containing protein [Erysipelothrix sp.]|nr:helix-turn-helix domain-containing protein [Erysipelothrix sp.]